MPDVNVNLAAVAAFRAHVVRFNREIESEFKLMRSHAIAIGEDWCDPKYRAFISAFDEVASGIDRYLAVTGDLERYLGALIERIQHVMDTSL